VTRNGVVKKTTFNAYDTSRQDGLIAINLRDGDELVRVIPTSGEDDILVVSEGGQGIRFAETDVRPMGRTASGVRGMRLRGGDRVVGAGVVDAGLRLLTVTEAGFGKRTDVDQFNRQGRGGQGVRAHKLHADRGRLVTGFLVADDDQLLLINDSGVIIRTAVDTVSVQGRDATGVRVMSVDEDTKVAAVARVLASEDGEDGEDGDDPVDGTAGGTDGDTDGNAGSGTGDLDGDGS
jgi:DNA gyrase subunit A